MGLFDFLKPDWRDRRLPASDETDAIRSILASLDRLEPTRARYLAAFAYLLGRVAHADREISESETGAMEHVVAEHGGLPEAQAAIVVQLAKTQNVLFGGTEDFLVAREFAAMASREEKLTLLSCLYAVSAADTSISTPEDNEIARIARELKIEHQDLISVRARFRRQLSVLQQFDKDGSGDGPV